MRKKRESFTKEEREEILKAIQEVHAAHVVKRLMALKLMAVDGISSAEAAKYSGLHATSINRNIRIYRKEGIEAITGKRHNHGNRYMSLDEEVAFLEKYREESEAGHIIEVSDIYNAYQEAVGHPVTRNAIYYLLKKHKWRKVMPRSKHPKKASPEEVDAYKKNHERYQNAEKEQAELTRDVPGRGWVWSNQ